MFSQMVQWLFSTQECSGSHLSRAQGLLCGVCMFSPCLIGLPAGPRVPPPVRHSWINKLALIVNDCLSLYEPTAPSLTPLRYKEVEVGQMDSPLQNVQDFIYCVKIHHSQRKGLFTVHLPLIYLQPVSGFD